MQDVNFAIANHGCGKFVLNSAVSSIAVIFHGFRDVTNGDQHPGFNDEGAKRARNLMLVRTASTTHRRVRACLNPVSCNDGSNSMEEKMN